MIERLDNRLNQNVGQPYGGNTGGNDGPRQNRMKRQNRIQGVKLNIPPFKGRSDLDTYLDWEMNIEHVFSCNDYNEKQKVKLLAVEFSDYAFVWWNKKSPTRYWPGSLAVEK